MPKSLILILSLIPSFHNAQSLDIQPFSPEILSAYSFPKFTAGTKQFKLTSDPDNTPSLEATSVALDNFSSQGFLETIQETIVATRNARVITDNISDQRETRRTVGTEWIDLQRSVNRGGDGGIMEILLLKHLKSKIEMEFL